MNNIVLESIQQSLFAMGTMIVDTMATKASAIGLDPLNKN